MKVLVTGAAGFIGFHLVQRLLKEGFVVVGLDNINDYYDPNLKYARLAETGIYSPDELIHNGGENRVYQEIPFSERLVSVTNSNYSFIRLNLEDKAEILSLFEAEHFDYVVNLAAQAGVRYSIENPDAYIQSNIVGFLNILEACRHNKIKHLIYASSSSVYGANSKIPFSEDDRVDNPVSLYAATKKSNELMAHAYSHLYKFPTTGLRFFTVYGPWGRPDMAPMLFADAITSSKPIKVFNNGDMARDFTFVEDVIAGICMVFRSKNIEFNLEIDDFNENYCIYNLGNGSPIFLTDFIDELKKGLQKTVLMDMLPMQKGDVKKTHSDITKIRQSTGYDPTTGIVKGVDEFLNWYCQFYK